MQKFTLILAALGLPATASEEDAEKRVTASAQLGADALKALGLPPTAGAAELAKRVQELSLDAAKLPALTTELATFRAERDARVAADRAAHIDDVIALRPEFAAVKDSLALHAQQDFAGFAVKHPRPTLAELTKAAAERSQREQDPERRASVTVTAANPATRDAPPPADPATRAKPDERIAEFRAVLQDYGLAGSIAEISDAIAKGHTPKTLDDALAAA